MNATFTRQDFFTPEFLHVVVVAQRNVVLRGYVDEDHLEAFRILAPAEMYQVHKPALPRCEISGPDFFEFVIPEDDEYNRQLVVLAEGDERVARAFLEYASSKRFHYVLNVGAEFSLDSLGGGEQCSEELERTPVVFDRKTGRFSCQFPDLSWEREVLARCAAVDNKDFEAALKVALGLFFVKVKEFFSHLCDSNEQGQLRVLKEFPVKHRETFLEVVRNYYQLTLPRAEVLTTSLSGARPEEGTPTPSPSPHVSCETVAAVAGHGGGSGVSACEGDEFDEEYDFIRKGPGRVTFARLLLEEAPRRANGPREAYGLLRQTTWRKGLPLEFVGKWFSAHWEEANATSCTSVTDSGEVERSAKEFLRSLGEVPVDGRLEARRLAELATGSCGGCGGLAGRGCPVSTRGAKKPRSESSPTTGTPARPPTSTPKAAASLNPPNRPHSPSPPNEKPAPRRVVAAGGGCLIPKPPPLPRVEDPEAVDEYLDGIEEFVSWMSRSGGGG
ncbi:MAG: hypothetical protein Kow0069_34030 [Promethearchaeota archaeon]